MSADAAAGLAVVHGASKLLTIGVAARCALRAAGLYMFGCLPGMTEAYEDRRTTELFTGFEATDNAQSGYLGVGYAFRNGLYDSGWRLRAVGSLGEYDYRGAGFTGGPTALTFEGESLFGAVFIGYQLRAGSFTFKLFGGIEAVEQSIHPHDPQNSVQGAELGGRVVAESWYEISPRWVASLDAAYGTAFEDYWSLARIGHRLTPKLTLGIEGGTLGNQEYDAGRAGGFGRIEFNDLQVTLSGGYTGNYLESEPSGYVSLGIYRPF